jgi:anti-sigma regulatory factor (Ser/Thr protein kinase)/anti-anti-sigma regulatory factor
VTTASGDDRAGKEVPAQRAGDADVVRKAFESMPSPMAAVEGPRHVIVAANAASRAFARQADLVGGPAWKLFSGVYGQRVTDLLDLVYAAGEPFAARNWSAEDGRLIDLTLAPWRDQEGGIRGVLVTMADATGPATEGPDPERTALREARSRAWHETVAVQEAVLPAALPVLPRARVAARYLPAAVDDVAGGNWFDAFALPDGRVALLVGNVAERGTAASAAMGRLRAVLRHALSVQPDLALVLGQADRYAASDDTLTAATLCLGVLDPADGECRYATCGHPPPLLVAADGTARFLPGTRWGPLAVGHGAPRASGGAAVPGSAVLGPGEVLLLYTEGLVQRPGRALGDALADLAVVAGDAVANRALAGWGPGTPAERASQLTAELLTRAGYSDDVTTLAVWRQPAPTAPRDGARPAGPGAVVALRRAFSDWLAALGVGFGGRQLAELAVAEALTNAVQHAYPAGRPGPVRLEAALAADGYLQTRVSDRGRWRPPDAAGTDRGQGLSVAAQFAEALQVSHPSPDAGPPGGQGTVVAMRHRLHHHPVIAPPVARPVDARAAQAPFAVKLVASAPVPRVRVSGPVDLVTADRLTSRLLAACRAGVLPLTVDLSAVTILAVAGVRALYRVAAQLAAHEQRLTLVSEPGSPAAAVLDLAQLPWAARH